MTIKRALAVVLVVLALAATYQISVARKLEVGTAYVARLLCIGTLVAGRDEAEVWASDLHDYGYLQGHVDYRRGLVRASLAGLAPRVALYRQGQGCTLPFPPADPVGIAGDSYRPEAGAAPPAIVDDGALAHAAAAWFAADLFTHAVLVMQDGDIIHESYGPGIHTNTPLLGWSMSKSVVHAELGRLLQLGLAPVIDAPAPVPQWQAAGDPRRSIRTDDLLRMVSGLDWNEDYFPPSDVTRMLFLEAGAAAFAASKSLVGVPGKVWLYSSGTTNILSAIVRRAAARAGIDSPARSLLFAPLGMRTAVAERDASGTEVGSSFVIASARDWGRFGQLYLDDGIFQGLRLLPLGWVAHAVTPTRSSGGRYGAQWWLNPESSEGRYWPDLPADTFSAQGHDGQYLLVIPSRRVVLVRLGAFGPARLRVNQLMAGLLEALPDK